MINEMPQEFKPEQKIPMNTQRVLSKEQIAKLEQQNKEEIDEQEESELHAFLGKLSEEFSSQAPFSLEDVNDAFGRYTKDDENLYTESSLQPYVDRGYLDYDDEKKEYTLTEKAIEKIEELA